MKSLITLATAFWVALFLTYTANADALHPREAVQHAGEFAVVEGVVAQVSRSRGGTTFINFGGRFPNHIFYAVIFRQHASKFPDVFRLEGRAVAIEGTIQMYKGKPQIILTRRDQMELK